MTDSLGRYMTPAWAARELWDAHFSDVGPGHTVLEPTCGDGRMLQAVPVAVPAWGVEIDPELADLARERTGRDVVTGDILEVDLPRKFDVVFGNPKFESAFMTRLLDRLDVEMDVGLRCGMIVPAYYMQTPSTVLRWSKRWTLYAELLPRTLFPRLCLPVVFALFTKDPVPAFKGMRLYIEADGVERLKPEFREMLKGGRGLWAEVVARALVDLGGEEHLTKIYERIGRKRPTENPWWREKIRQTLQRGPFCSKGNGVWSIEKAA
jgi:adenine-specific DNA-methyltransferase